MSMTSDEGDAAYSGFPTVVFEVSKIHHKFTWLRMRRYLRLTSSALENCRGSSESTIQATKSHPLRNLELVALKSKSSFMLQFQNQHPYIYSSPKALAIVWEVKKRCQVIRTAEGLERLIPGASQRGDREKLMRLFCRGTLTPPQQGDQRTFEMRVKMFNLIKSGDIDVKAASRAFTEEIARLSDLKAKTLSAQHFSKFRTVLTETREQAFTTVVQMRHVDQISLPMMEDDGEIEQALEHCIQLVVVAPVAETLRALVCCCPSVIERKNEFKEKSSILAQLPAATLGILPQTSHIKFDLALEHLSKAIGARTPSEHIDHVYNFALSIITTLEAVSLLNSPGSSVKLSADDLLPIMIYCLAHCSSLDGLVEAREFASLVGDSTECTERAYYYTMFSSAIEFIIASQLDANTSHESSPPNESLNSTFNCSSPSPSSPGSPFVSPPAQKDEVEKLYGSVSGEVRPHSPRRYPSLAPTIPATGSGFDVVRARRSISM